VLTGAHREAWTQQGTDLALFNTALLFRANDAGRVLGVADKHLLAPITEAHFQAGTSTNVLALDGVQAGILICWESMYPRLSLDLAESSNILVVLTNDVGFGDSSVTTTHARQGQSRAIETGRPLVRAAQAGISLFVAPDGAIQGELGLFEVGVLTAEVQPMQGWTWFTRWGRWLIEPGVWVACALLAVLRLIRGWGLPPPMTGPRP
jgi:apolipoprotein N-acyltransferase